MIAAVSLFAAAAIAFVWIRMRHKRKASGGAH
jgi:hypothetical protein